MKTLQGLQTRLRSEYTEMPGLRLTAAQAQRLCGIEATVCQIVLDALVAGKVLYRTADGHYARVSDGAMPPPMDGSSAKH